MYDVVLGDVAQKNRDSLDPQQRSLVDTVLQEIAVAPRAVDGASCNAATTEWTAPIGKQGIVLYTISDQHQRVLVWRIQLVTSA